MSLSDFSIRNSVFAWMLMVACILFGGIAYKELGISEMPDVDFPIVTVHLTYEGASPEIMETDVVDPVEASMTTIQGIRSISSTSRDGHAVITVEFELHRNIDAAVQEVQTKIASVQKRLPKNVDPPVVVKTNPEDQPILWISLTGKTQELRALMEFARRRLQDQIQTVSGVGEITLGGYVEPNLRVWIDPAKLAAYELTVQDVLQAIQREHIEVAAGQLETPTTEMNLRVMGEAMTPVQFANIIIPQRGGATIFRQIRIGDVATVVAGLDDIRRISRTNGEPAVGLGIKKQRGTNAVAVADALQKRLTEIQRTLPPEYTLTVTWDSTKFIRETIRELRFTLLLSALLTAFVCLLFLGSWSSTINVLLAIPTSIVGAFLFLYFFGFTLNTFTFLGLILAMGIVVDDAIMVLENIVRHREEGLSAWEAAQKGAREITGAAIAATLSIAAIFLPVVFMKGAIGRFFFQFGITMSIAVGLSLLEALTLTPMRCSRFLKVGSSGRLARSADRFFVPLAQRYARGLEWCLRHRALVLIGAVAMFAASFLTLKGIRQEYLPQQDQGMFLLRAQTPLGSSLESTDAKAREAEKIFAAHPAIRRFFVAVGGFGGGEANAFTAFITLHPRAERPVDPALGRRPSQQDVMNALRPQLQKIPDLRPILQDLSTRGFTAQRGFPIEFSVRGPDWETLTTVAQSLETKMKTLPLLTDVDSDYEFGQPEVQVVPKREAARARGVSMESIGTVVSAMMGGVRAGRFTSDGHRDDIRVRLVPHARQRVEDIARLSVRNNFNQLVSLQDLVEIQERRALKSITRRDRERAISLFANVAQGGSQQQALAAVEAIAATQLPEGYRLVWGGSSQAFKESFQLLFFALLLGIAVAYMILGSQYNSFLHPIVVLLALPFSITGAFVALYLTHSSLNLYSYIGILLLMGIVKKNAILLVDFTNQRRREGHGVIEALRRACPQRLRPILMTSVATIAGALPPALAFGPGAETRGPMAIVVIGGVLFSALLTLFVVPCAYSVLARWELKRGAGGLGIRA